MNKRRKTFLAICLSVSALLIMAVTVFAATSNIIEDQLAEKKEAMSSNGLRIESVNPSDYVVDSNDTEYEYITEQYNRELIENYNKAVDSGFVFQYEMFLNEDYMHDYRFVKSFPQEELQSAIFEDDYSVININGNRYYIKWGYLHIPGNRHARPEGTACDSASNGMSRLVNCYSG